MIEIERKKRSYHYFSDDDRKAILRSREDVSERQFQQIYPCEGRIDMFLEYFEKDGVWGNSTIATYAALMLKTNYQTFCLDGSRAAGNAWFVHQHRHEIQNDPDWRRWIAFLAYPVELPPTPDMEMYLQWRNGNHYEAACLGICPSGEIQPGKRREKRRAIRQGVHKNR